MKLEAQDMNDESKVKAFREAQSHLAQNLRQVFALSERYPEIRANDNFRELQVQLEGTENRIQRARQVYNQTVMDFNNSILKWPGRYFAGNRQPKKVYEADVGSEKSPRVNFK